MTHSLFTVMPAFVILFWLILFCLDENKNRTKGFLIFFLSVALVNYSIHWCYFNNNYEAYRILDSIWVFTSLSVYPLYYYYIRLLTKDTKIDYRWTWILLPAFLLALYSALIYLMMSPQEIEIFSSEILYHIRPRSENYSTLIKLQLLRMEIFKVIFTIEVILTVYYGLRLIKRFNKKVFAYYSDVQHRELSNIRITLLFLFITAIISMISNIIGKDFFTDNPYLLAFPSIAHSIALFGLSYAGYKQSFTISDLTKDQFQPVDNNYQEEEEDENVILSSKYDELYERMEHLVKSEKIFRDSDLRLDDLALMLGTNRTYVSLLINNRINSNFCDYINSHRITHAKEMLSSQKGEHLLLADIALESGFSNQSSFYRVFMKMEGITPAKYRKWLTKKNNCDKNALTPIRG